MTTTAQKVIDDVLRLDGEADASPWVDDNDSVVDSMEYRVWEKGGVFSGSQIADVNHGINSKLITTYRTSAPKLAKALKFCIDLFKEDEHEEYCREALSQINQIFGAEDEKA